MAGKAKLKTAQSRSARRLPLVAREDLDLRHPDGKEDHLHADAERVEPVADVGDRPVRGVLDVPVLSERRDHKPAREAVSQGVKYGEVETRVTDD